MPHVKFEAILIPLQNSFCGAGFACRGPILKLAEALSCEKSEDLVGNRGSWQLNWIFILNSSTYSNLELMQALSLPVVGSWRYQNTTSTACTSICGCSPSQSVFSGTRCFVHPTLSPWRGTPRRAQPLLQEGTRLPLNGVTILVSTHLVPNVTDPQRDVFLFFNSLSRRFSILTVNHIMTEIQICP